MESAEKDLFETVRSGDITAFEMSFRKYYQPLCNYAFSFVQQRDDAEEIVQSCFVSFWEKKTSLDLHTALKPYLYAMVRNSCLNVIKHEKIKKQYAEVEMVMGERSSESASHGLVMSELESKIRMAMNKLPQQCRLVFKLSRFEELKYAEIAEQLNISIKTVENQMGKALRIMREELREYLPLVMILLTYFFK